MLTSPDGYQLTEDGKRVLICLLGGSIGKLFRFSDEELMQFEPIAGCATGTGTLSQSQPPQSQPPQSQPPIQSEPRNTQKSLNLPPDTRVTDIFQVYVTEIHGNKIITSVNVPNTSSKLEEVTEGQEVVTIPFYFYAGFAPIGTPVNVCVKNQVTNRENCQSLTHTVNPELVNINSP
jgi:hypothetical protein